MQYKGYEKGFTLVEVLIAVILVGLAVTALLTASGSFTMANGAGADLSTAEFLAEQIRERTALMSYDSLPTLDEQAYSPPIDAAGQVLDNFAAFTQQVVVEKVSAGNFEQVVPDDDSSPFVRVTVRVFLNGSEISSAGWIRAQY